MRRFLTAVLANEYFYLIPAKLQINWHYLKDYNVLANNKLDADSDSMLITRGVPHYTLIDENGKIIKNNAPYPSQTKELKELIENY